MSRIANLAASSTLIFMAVLLMLSRIPIQGFVQPIPLVVASAVLVTFAIRMIDGHKSSLIALISIFGFCLLMAMWGFATQIFYPAGHDGFGYHLTAIWDLAAGWNPFFSSHNNIWVDSYPSGYWALQGFIVSTTGLPLSGQGLIIGLMVVLAFQAYAFFMDRISPLLPSHQNIISLFFAALIVCNPAIVTQIQTHYVDAPLYLFGSSLLFLLIMDMHRESWISRWAAVSCIILAVNTKTSALYFTPLIIFGGFVVEIYFGAKETGLVRQTFQWIRAKGILYALAGIFAILVVGYKPYVTNVLDHDTLLYPNSDRIMKGNTPVNVQDPMPGPMKFLYGVLARTEHNRYGIPTEAPIHLKIPGSFELKEFYAPDYDTRRGGFGPLFSLALIGSILLLLIGRLSAAKAAPSSSMREGDSIAIYGLILLGITIFFPEPWWARYVPFLWLTPILFVVAVLCFASNVRKMSVFMSITMAITVLSLIGCVLSGALGSARQHIKTYERFASLERMKSAPVVELFEIKDTRVFSDYQSKSQSDADIVYAEILGSEGINTKIVTEFDPDRCRASGYFFGGIIWCIPKAKDPSVQNE
ncbi:MAG: hypothetical protein CMN56_16750 [Sneathiella sp.]|uniref:hypothetical protein n=1 Tax=Sneathiella sp. TaxID=1964365 RepID=UPI000C5F7DCB|nr:hypothetical protein [Sneathiella sp.]MAZ04785.1 hypothetical protein [Sneathiella sp.]|tara:strand:+ start:94 stop:1851 length:1758 start_codon:yes stop_codon:yes gene_type:complete